MSIVKRWLAPIFFGAILTLGLLQASSALLISTHSNGSYSFKSASPAPATHPAVNFDRLHIGLVPHAAPRLEAPNPAHFKGSASAADSIDETRRALASTRGGPPKAVSKKLLPNIPVRAYSQDPAAYQNPAQAIAPTWVKEDWVTRYPQQDR
jgi:hypothetical protein